MRREGSSVSSRRRRSARWFVQSRELSVFVAPNPLISAIPARKWSKRASFGAIVVFFRGALSSRSRSRRRGQLQNIVPCSIGPRLLRRALLQRTAPPPPCPAPSVRAAVAVPSSSGPRRLRRTLLQRSAPPPPYPAPVDRAASAVPCFSGPRRLRRVLLQRFTLPPCTPVSPTPVLLSATLPQLGDHLAVSNCRRPVGARRSQVSGPSSELCFRPPQANHQLYWLASHLLFLYGCITATVSEFWEGRLIVVKILVKLLENIRRHRRLLP